MLRGQHRVMLRGLLLATSALLLLAMAPSPAAAKSRVHVGFGHGGLHFGIGYYGGHHHYRGYYPHRYRYYPRVHYYPRAYYYPPYAYFPYRADPRLQAAAGSGALDFKVKPKKAQVYLNGKYVGTAGNFDGWPQYLWLPEGEVELVLVHAGYRTVARRVEIQAGQVIDVREVMQPGESRPAEEVSTWVESPRPAPAPRAPAAERPAPRPAPRARPSPAPRDIVDARGEPGLLRLTVAPEDASVYLDGRFVGMAGEAGKASRWLINPGEHRLEVVRPGYHLRELSFTVEAGTEVDLAVELETLTAGNAALNV